MSTIPLRRLLVCTIACSSLLLAACGSDDDDASTTTTAASTAETTTTAASSGSETDTEAYCAAVEDINSSGGTVTDEQLDAYVEAAPEELQDTLGPLVEAIKANDGSLQAAMSDPEAAAAIEEVTAVEEETCGGGEDGPDQDPSVTEVDPDATRIDVETTDYAFDFEVPTEAGRYSFVSTNDGEEGHVMILVKIEEGSTIDEVIEAEGEAGAEVVLESEFAAPGGELVVTADLTPGDWALLCPVTDAEETPHFVHGMIEEFTIA